MPKTTWNWRIGSPAREAEISTPRPGDDFPVIAAADVTVSEALPVPAPGPVRERLVNAIDARALKAQDALTVVLDKYLDRSLGVITARVRGPKARKHTRWHIEEKAAGVSTVEREYKALDPNYVVPDKLTEELRGEIEPVALRVATSAARDTASNLGAADGLAAVDTDAIAAAVEEAVGRILGVAERHAREVRAAVLDADKTAEDLDAVLERIEAAHRKGGNWVLLSGRTLANALANDAALRQARKLGVTHTQWISRRDERVRPTHVVADGQVRRIDDKFKVGRFNLKYPGDPSDLPESWGELAQCRCGLIFEKPSDAARKMNEMAESSRRDRSAPGKALKVLRSAVEQAAASEAGEVLTPTPEGYKLPPVASLVTLKQPIVAYRGLSALLAASPGQMVRLPGRPVLGLVAPTTAIALTVFIPMGIAVGVAGGAVILPEGTMFEVLSMAADEVVVQAVAP